MPETLSDRIHHIVQSVVQQSGLDLVELKIQQRLNQINIQLLIDWPKGGITIDECTRVNKELARQFDEQSDIAELYTLEVSSPGIDRPLKTLKDFNRATGRDIHVFLNVPVENKIEHTGTLVAVSAEIIQLKTDKSQIDIPIANIQNVKQVIK